jgi:hypothetical protein
MQTALAASDREALWKHHVSLDEQGQAESLG